MQSSNSNNAKFYDDAADFMPICGHYDNLTLMTKNGELLQTIRIKGVGVEAISPQLDTLRERLREALAKHIDTTKIACWIHTCRRTTDLDDNAARPTSYTSYIHKEWVKKNHWHQKFVNVLYVSFIHQAADLSIHDSRSFFQTLSTQKNISHHDEYLNNARAALEKVVSGVTQDLSMFSPKRLGIYFVEQEAYCEMLSFFCGVMRGVEKPIKIHDGDFSKIMGAFDYAVGFNKIEIVTEDTLKYGAVISIKEYQDLSTEALDELLQIPTEFIVTEVFYFIDPKIAKDYVENQIYTYKISRDPDMMNYSKLDKIQNAEKLFKQPYCHQQISILLLNRIYENLDSNVSAISEKLCKLGLINVVEDVHIESMFWCQIPGNFNFLKRIKPTSIESVAALSCLHFRPYGTNDRDWGGAITLLRTERGTPFFFNFHTKDNFARTLIVGTQNSGKTTLSNFVTSEALKFNPCLLSLAFTKKSSIFTIANGGKWINNPFCLDFFKIDSIKNSITMIAEFLRLMAGDASTPLSEEEGKILADLLDYIMTIPEQDRSFDKLSDFVFPEGAGASLKQKMSPYLKGGEYHNYFIDDGRWDQEASRIMGIEFSDFSNESFKSKHYPEEDRFLPAYFAHFAKFSIFREMLVTMNTLKFHDHFKERKRIIRLESLNMSFSGLFSAEYYEEYFKIFENKDVVYTCLATFNERDPLFASDFWKNLHSSFETKIYLSAELVTKKWKDLLFFEQDELEKLQSILVASRLFLLKQNGERVICALSLGDLISTTRLLSPEDKIIQKFNKFILEQGSEVEQWMQEFCEILNQRYVDV